MGNFDRRGEMLRQADNGAGSGGTPPPDAAGNQTGETPPETLTFETWYAGLDAPAKTLFDGHLQGLTDLAKQVKDLAAKAEKGSDLERQLTDMQATLQTAERRAAFVEDAIRPEVGCVNAKAAYALAVAENLFDRQGRPDWNALKQTAPELFRKPGVGSADGGAGLGNSQPKLSMNDIIRRAAGRG